MMRESPGRCSNTPGAWPTGRIRNCGQNQSLARSGRETNTEHHPKLQVLYRDCAWQGRLPGEETPDKRPERRSRRVGDRERRQRRSPPHRPDTRPLRPEGGLSQAATQRSHWTKMEARSSPGLSAWLVIRACSQESLPGPVRQETPEPHKRVRRRCDCVAAPGLAGGDRLLYGLGDRLGPTAQPGDGTPFVVIRRRPRDGFIEACVRVLPVWAVHRADGGVCEVSPDAGTSAPARKRSSRIAAGSSASAQPPRPRTGCNRRC
jgi:hypothetical protein